MLKFWEQLRLAISFLTLLPLAPKQLASEENLAKSVRYFSLVGVIFGLFNLVILDLLHEPWLIALALVLSKTFLSGGLHMDGLMDCFDGIACGKQKREEILTVMKDSRVGAFGSMAGTLALITQVVTLAQIDYSQNFYLIAFLLFLLPIMSRFLMVCVLSFQVKLAEVNSSLLIFKKYENKWLNLILNTILAKIIAWIFIFLVPLTFNQLMFCDLIIVPWMFASWLVYAWLKYKLKGHNGDSMGAGLELSESLFFMGIAVLF